MANELNIVTNRIPTNVNLVVETKDTCKVKVKCTDKINPNIVYFERVFDMQGKEEMNIRLPQSRNQVLVSVTSGNGDEAVRVVSFKKSKLLQYPMCYKGKNTHEFIKFAQQISERLNSINNGIYKSINGNYTIQIFDTIEGTNTPARIHNGEGYIQIAKSKMASNSVPMNMAILLHEFSHFYKNENITDEIEADLNGLKIYLGLNYPNLEAHNGFVDVFEHSDTPQNRERYEYILNYITNFKKLRHKVCI